MTEIEKLRHELKELKAEIAGQKENGKDIWDKLSSITPLIAGVLIAGLGTLATFIYNNRQLTIEAQEKLYEDTRLKEESLSQQKLQRIDALDKNMKYLISKDPRERQLGYFNFSTLGFQSEALQIITMNKDSTGGFNFAVNIAKTSKNAIIRDQASEAVQTLMTPKEILSTKSQFGFALNKPLGFDVSHNTPFLDGATIAKTSIKFVFIKATQGENLVDPACGKNVELAKKYKLLYSLYHFYIVSASAEKQASNFNAAYKKYGSSLPLSLDLEWQVPDVPIDKNKYIDSVFKFISLLKIAKKNDLIIFTGVGWAKMYLDNRFGNYKLALMNYSRGYNPNNGIPGIWSKANYWQFNGSQQDLIVSNE